MPRPRARYLTWLLFVLAIAPAQPASRQPTLEPFTINHEARVNSPADVRFLLDAPAGKHGFIRAADGHLVTPSGSRFRIWGINITGWLPESALLPPKPGSTPPSSPARHPPLKQSSHEVYAGGQDWEVQS
jgi:hypothetical protein